MKENIYLILTKMHSNLIQNSSMCHRERHLTGILNKESYCTLRIRKEGKRGKNRKRERWREGREG